MPLLALDANLTTRVQTRRCACRCVAQAEASPFPCRSGFGRGPWARGGAAPTLDSAPPGQPRPTVAHPHHRQPFRYLDPHRHWLVLRLNI